MVSGVIAFEPFSWLTWCNSSGGVRDLARQPHDQSQRPQISAPVTQILPFIAADDIAALITPRAAVDTITGALRRGADPATDPARVITPLSRGQFLLMPSEVDRYAGVKVATVAPNNPSRSLPRIQALYLLFDSETLTPSAILDGSALTSLRTPAVSIAALSPFLATSASPLRVVLFGAGPQAVAHLDTLLSYLRGRRSVAAATYVVRRPADTTLPAHEGVSARIFGIGSDEAQAELAAADVVMCATSASEPLFDSSVLKDSALVVAIGSHEPHAREIDAALCARAQVIVEDIDTALRESGDIILAIAEGALRSDELIPLKSILDGSRPLETDRPVFFKSSGMSWEDLVVASAIHERLLDRDAAHGAA
jgi:ornithine cyclodeaminase/alanine dehydrogenase-like protein (mu-crystallin family)